MQYVSLFLGDSNSNPRTLKSAEIGFDDAEYSYGDGSEPFAYFQLSKAELRHLKNRSTLTVVADKRLFRFSLDGSAAAITAAWDACDKWVKASSRAQDGLPSFNSGGRSRDTSAQEGARDGLPSLNSGGRSEDTSAQTLGGGTYATLFLLLGLVGLFATWLRRQQRERMERLEPDQYKAEREPQGDTEAERERQEEARQRQEEQRRQQARERAKRERQETERQRREEERRQQESNTRLISCPSCRRKVRILLPLKSNVGRCGACGGRFSATLDEHGHLYIEALRDTAAEESVEEIKTVSDCFRMLELDEGASKEMIKKAYQMKIRAYHPDKVNSLGERLREVAEAETKKLNQAMRMLREQGYA
ncbi:J domain-containing protein [Thiocapsa roseopersicina]|uniref:DnaJ domain-containing protein n=1 Tax=Thiocapsa roseopersicina TaxID=1058 RepID=A0A1H3B2B7_THIRO|nr:J domain-containing protein [Thiocapsa roseopersicina]SDX36082.1 DnaJ domain-containing protein [Thiocapsa roseopersicina]